MIDVLIVLLYMLAEAAVNFVVVAATFKVDTTLGFVLTFALITRIMFKRRVETLRQAVELSLQVKALENLTKQKDNKDE